MNDFEEIAHSGGSIEIKANGIISIRDSKAGVAACWYGLCYSYNGMPLSWLPLDGGIGRMSSRAIPQPSFLILIGSDRKGFFGRVCPVCKKYFRTEAAPEYGYCSYCGLRTHTINFMTDNQKAFAEAEVKAYREVLDTDKDFIINLDDILKSLSNNKSPFSYSEEKQQTHLKCSDCKVEFDILGIYGFCHNCGKRNSFQIIEGKLKDIQYKIENPPYPADQKDKLEAEWEDAIENCVSEFEAFGRDMRTQLLEISALPQRKKKIEEINFQNPLTVAADLMRYFEIDLFFKAGVSDQTFINKFFNIRHLITHKRGIVDQEYIDKTKDANVRIGQKIRVEKSNAKHLIEIVTQMAKNLFEAYEILFK